MDGHRLTELRASRGWTQAELSRRSLLPAAHISQLESGAKDNPTWDTISKLANAFNISTAEMVAAITPEPTPSAA
jgi:transcriptional regulator with XRE-family HTH domain